MTPSTDTPFSTPPGPTTPPWLQAALAAFVQLRTLRRLHRTYGDAFTVHLMALGKVVVIADPALIKQTFTAPSDVLFAGERSPLRQVLGAESLLTIDGMKHLQQRRLLLPPFHGERMRSYEAIVAEEAGRELGTWPDDRELPTLEPMMRITLNAILRAVFGAAGAELEALRRILPELVTIGSRVATLPFLQRDLGPRSPWGRFRALRAAFDEQVDALIADARGDVALAERSDVLALLVQATHADGRPMSRDELADQLLTLLVAGHETTAATLSWAIERIRRHPDLLARLQTEAREGGRELRDATIREVQRTRPVIGGAARYVMQPFDLGPWRLRPGTTILASAILTQSDGRFYDDPVRFRPERFVGAKPDTYAWLPFGGGIRRCIGASFAHMEMDVVLRTLLCTHDLRPTSAPGERWRFRGVAFAPADGGRAVVRRRHPTTAGPATGTAVPVAA
ncbi:cytochrome P450 [Patulibacter minatonensis]|uniref:cytochrome P450 n=1 Tax=Patulibacter minatonensis TaxID=298163 RepID=UPI000478F773|nr:cytochrome P450 [Patulibacter minatonensis]